MLSFCPVCKAPADSHNVICDDCRAELDSECFDTFMDRCPVCFYPRVASLYSCRRCAQGPAKRIYPVARYDGKLSYSILDSFKFHGHKEMAKVIALYLSRALSVLDPENKALIVPIPCSSKRLSLLGWDPMVEVCKALRRPYECLLINSTTRDIQQKKLNREQRIQASQGRYELNPKCKTKPDRPIIVIDDVVTTMSTMNSAMDFLSEQGFSDVSGASWLCEL